MSRDVDAGDFEPAVGEHGDWREFWTDHGNCGGTWVYVKDDPGNPRVICSCSMDGGQTPGGAPTTGDRKDLTVRLHATAEDGLPSDELLQDGRVAFLWGTRILTGTPVETYQRRDYWEADDEARNGQIYYSNVTHWLEFPGPLGDLAHGIVRSAG